MSLHNHKGKCNKIYSNKCRWRFFTATKLYPDKHIKWYATLPHNVVYIRKKNERIHARPSSQTNNTSKGNITNKSWEINSTTARFTATQVFRSSRTNKHATNRQLLDGVLIGLELRNVIWTGHSHSPPCEGHIFAAFLLQQQKTKQVIIIYWSHMCMPAELCACQLVVETKFSIKIHANDTSGLPCWWWTKTSVVKNSINHSFGSFAWLIYNNDSYDYLKLWNYDA